MAMKHVLCKSINMPVILWGNGQTPHTKTTRTATDNDRDLAEGGGQEQGAEIKRYSGDAHSHRRWVQRRGGGVSMSELVCAEMSLSCPQCKLSLSVCLQGHSCSRWELESH